jgi:CheY-like chemotaxis protein
MPGKRIVIVDDQIDSTRLLHKNLESLEQDFQINTAFSGEEALLELSSGDVDLLITDFRLPGITGLELMDKFRQTNPEGKVILISGVTDQTIRQKVAQAGASAFFFKPIDIPEFLDAVERALHLVDTILQPELHLYSEELEEEEADHEQTRASMTAQISDLRASLDAAAVMLVNEQGQVAARAGDLPDPELETALMPVLMRAFTAGVSISHFLGQHIPDHFYSFRGENYDLFLAPVGESYCLMALTRPILPQQLGNISDQINKTARSVLLSLSRLGVLSSADKEPLPEPTGEEKTIPAPRRVRPEPGEDPGFVKPSTGALAAAGEDQSLEALFTSTEEAPAQDADAFWDTLPEEDIKPELTSGDSLSYDQAAKLGFAPPEE